MSITLPNHYVFAQEQNAAIYNEPIDEDTLLALRDNGHYLYAAQSLKNAMGHYWPNGLLTSEFEADLGEVVLLLVYRHTHIRGEEVGLRVLYEAIGEVSVSIQVFALTGGSPLAGFLDTPVSDGIEGSWTIAGGWTEQSVLLGVRIAVQDGESAPAGLRYLLFSELPLELGNLP